MLLYMCAHSALPGGAGADWDTHSALDDARHVARARGTQFTCFTQFALLDSALDDARTTRARVVLSLLALLTLLCAHLLCQHKKS
jgi:hypothetical protein